MKQSAIEYKMTAKNLRSVKPAFCKFSLQLYCMSSIGRQQRPSFAQYDMHDQHFDYQCYQGFETISKKKLILLMYSWKQNVSRYLWHTVYTRA